jgi:hypothetical protein
MRRLLRQPATWIGLVLGLIVGLVSAVGGLVAGRWPILGFAIAVLTPILSFAFEQLLGVVFPKAYRKRVAPFLRRVIRWLLNDSFLVEFTYQLVFRLEALEPPEVSSAVGANEESGPKIHFRGGTYLHLQYPEVRDFVVVSWSPVTPLSDENEEEETQVVISLQPSVRQFTVRGSETELARLAHHIDRLRQRLEDRLGSPTQRVATARAWLAAYERPHGPVPPKEPEVVTGGEVRRGDGWIELTGDSATILPALGRWIAEVAEPSQA